MITWHYAVNVPGYYFQPACTGDLMKLKGRLGDHGITRLRGEVTCPLCLKAMGLT